MWNTMILHPKFQTTQTQTYPCVNSFLKLFNITSTGFVGPLCIAKENENKQNVKGNIKESENQNLKL